MNKIKPIKTNKFPNGQCMVLNKIPKLRMIAVEKSKSEISFWLEILSRFNNNVNNLTTSKRITEQQIKEKVNARKTKKIIGSCEMRLKMKTVEKAIAIK